MNRHQPDPSTLRRSVFLLSALVLTAAAVTFGVAAARQAPDTPTTVDKRILAVDTRRAVLSQQYAVDRTFVGRAEAARSSRLGFELEGQVVDVLVDEGARVTPGQTVARLDTQRLRARRAELEAAKRQARANLMLAERTLRRIQGAIDLNAVSQQRYDEARYNKDVQAAAVRQIESQLARVDIDLGKSRLRAPFAGVVAKRLIDEGTVVRPGDVIVELLEMDRMEIRVGVNPAAARKLQPGASLRVSANGQSIPTRIRAVLPERSAGTRTVGLLLTVEDPQTGLRHGDLVEVTVSQQLQASGFWLPRRALTESSRGLWACYVALPADSGAETVSGHVIQRRELELLHQAGDRVFVRGTLSDGEVVVVGGLQRLVPGQRVSIRSLS